MRRLIAVVIIAVAGASPTQNADPAPRVSLIQLLARPADFDGQRVHLVGYVTVGFEEQALFLNPADHENGIFENSVALDLGNKQMPLGSDEYAQVEGTFHAKPVTSGRLGVGKLDSITKLQPWILSKKAQTIRTWGCW